MPSTPRSGPPPKGYYGVVAVGDGWRPVTPESSARTLMLQDALDAGATHIGHWTGRKWEHVEPVDSV